MKRDEEERTKTEDVFLVLYSFLNVYYAGKKHLLETTNEHFELLKGEKFFSKILLLNMMF